MSPLPSLRRVGGVGLLALGIIALFAGPAGAADWGDPFTVSTTSTRPAGPLKVGASTGGVTTFLWPASTSGGVTVESRRMGTTGSLGPLKPLSPTFDDSPFTDLFINPPTGKGAAGWETGNPGGTKTYQVRLLPRDGSLGSLKTVLSSPNAADFGLGTKGDGTAVAIWSSNGRRLSDPYLTQFRTVSPSGELGPIRTLQSVPRNQVRSGPHGGGVVAAPGGNTFLLWQWTSDLKPHLAFRRLAPDGTLGPVTEVLGPRSFADGDASLTWDAVALPDGGVAVAFTRAAHNGSTFTRHFIEARRISASGQLGPIKQLGSAAPRSSEPYFAVLDHPQIATDPFGNVTVAWVHFLTDFSAAVKSRRLAASGALGETRTLTGDTSGAGSPDVAVDANGVATAVFPQGPSSNGTQPIRARRVLPGGTLGPVKTLGQGFGPQVTVGPGDVTTAAWTEADLFHSTTLKAARFSPGP